MRYSNRDGMQSTGAVETQTPGFRKAATATSATRGRPKRWARLTRFFPSMAA
ncbi:hypothetical protein ACIRG4_04795 [Streptomyces sp. NPDC102395]|uniref:hypothetical protein n=1 Tax=Streptomyces sp. NPDC102395 TaxID=3366168 RepID=UPI003829DE8B